MEVNASDERSQKKLRESLLYIAQSGSLFNKRLILVDEVDGVDGRTERGATKVLLKLLNVTTCPVIFTANDWRRELETLKKKCKVIKFNRLRIDSILKYLQEMILIDDESLQKIAENSKGNLRSALQDLENEYSTKIRTGELLPAYSVSKIVFSNNEKEALEIIDNIDLEIDNIPYRLYELIVVLAEKNKIDKQRLLFFLNSISLLDGMIGRKFSGSKDYFLSKKVLRLLISQLYLGSDLETYVQSSTSLYGNYALRKKVRNGIVAFHESKRKASLLIRN